MSDTPRIDELPSARLGRCGLRISRLVLGTMTFGLQTDEAESHRILDAAAAAGIDTIDTADVYPLGGTLDTVGRTEEIVGRWLAREPGRRARFVVATKGGNAMGDRRWQRGGSRRHLLAAIDASLARLGTDWVDLYQLHIDDPATPLDEMLAAMDAIVSSGRARYIGVSNFLAYRLALAIGCAERRGFAPMASIQPRYSLLFREIERELLPLCSETGTGVLVYNPLAGGLLTGKHRADAPPPAGRFTLGSSAKMYQQRYWHEREFATIERVRAIVTEHGLPLIGSAVAWALAHPAVSAAIIGASRAEQLAASIEGATLQLPAEVKRQLDEATHEHRFGDAPR